MRRIRGDRIGMVFQEPMTSLNPTQRVGYQVAEVLKLHRGMGHSEAKALAIGALKKVGIGNAERRFDQYPHELSGGLRQRVMIAMAIVCGPKLLIADEPTTALDVTIQAQIIELLKAVQEDLGLSILLITHDLGIVAEMCRSVVVMYAGRVVERGATAETFGSPRHPTRPVSSGRRLAVPGRVSGLPPFRVWYRRRECGAGGAALLRAVPAFWRNAAASFRRSNPCRGGWWPAGILCHDGPPGGPQPRQGLPSP